MNLTKSSCNLTCKTTMKVRARTLKINEMRYDARSEMSNSHTQSIHHQSRHPFLRLGLATSEPSVHTAIGQPREYGIMK